MVGLTTVDDMSCGLYVVPFPHVDVVAHGLVDCDELRRDLSHDQTASILDALCPRNRTCAGALLPKQQLSHAMSAEDP